MKAVNFGKVKDPYYPSIYGVGYCGVGNYKLTYTRGGKKRNTPAYEVWLGKIKTCYGDAKQSHLYKGKGVTVCKEWHNFQVFAEWFYKQVKVYGNGGFVDKDLAFLGNTEYSPFTARYVPPAVNGLFAVKSGNNINGVHFCSNKKKYVAQLQRGELTSSGKKRQSYLGAFNSYEEASKVYLDAKVEHVRNVALKYQDKLPPDLFYKLYTGAMNYVDYYTTEQGENQ